MSKTRPKSRNASHHPDLSAPSVVSVSPALPPLQTDNKIRLGLCCLFLNEPIRFRTTTAQAMMRLNRKASLAKLSALCLENASALLSALEYCMGKGIGDFRVNSQILPLRTHPKAGYVVADLPDAAQIIAAFRKCGRFAKEHNLRLTFHPDQFILLNSPYPEVATSSIAELEYQAEVAEWVNADVINIHAGGGYGDKPAALMRLKKTLGKLSNRVRKRFTLENDDRIYTPRDLLPLCREEHIPLVYDVHHHRCLPDGYSLKEATQLAMATWNREPLFHLSTPRDGWKKPHPSRHSDYITPRDFPREWLKLRRPVTIEVEAKAKELAVLRVKIFLKLKRRVSSSH